MRAIRLTIALLLSLVAVNAAPETAAERVVVRVNVDGAIGPATADHITRGLEHAEEQGAEAVILHMDTPGGLATSMRDIIQDILASPVPVVVYVAPSGARAASAGTYILYASHVAAMAPGTNVGAATPVQIGGGMPQRPEGPAPGGQDEGPEQPPAEDGNGGGGQQRPAPEPPAKPTVADKAVSDAAAYLRSLAQMRGRNVEWAEKAVREAASLGAQDALEQNVIDLMAPNVEALLAAIDGRTVGMPEGERTLETRGARVDLFETDWRTELLAVITDPNIAYLLMMIGIYGLIFEFINPGTLGPGIIGAVALLLALYALNVLPVNYAGLGLVLLGVGLMTAEVFAPSFGVLGVGGAAALAIGSVIMFDTGSPHFEISLAVVAGVVATSLAFFMIVLGLVIRARGRPVVSGRQQMVGSPAEVVDWSGKEGRVRIHGETWRASGNVSFAPGQRVRVAGLKGLTLDVEPLTERKDDNA